MRKLLKKMLYFLLFIGLLLGGLFAYVTNPVLGSVPAFPGALEVDTNQLRADVEFLCAVDPPRNFYNPSSLDDCAAYLSKRLKKMGYEPEEQVYTVKGHDYRNVLAYYGPEDGERLVIGAHYDVHDDQPGADDNASAVAGLLEIARLLQEQKPKLNFRIDLVLYTLEEPPAFRSTAMGSYVHAQSLKKAGLTVKGMICLEMIGYFSDAPKSQEYPAGIMKAAYPTTGNFIAVVGPTGQLGFTRKVKKGMMSACGVDVVSINAPKSIPGIDFSDHQNYWDEGWDAVMITDTSFYRNKNYHQKTDTPDSLDYSRMGEVVKGVYAAAVGL